jgi:alpha-amylase
VAQPGTDHEYISSGPMLTIARKWIGLGVLVAVCLAGRTGAADGGTPSVADAAAPPWRLDWAEGAVFYEIFVRSFADSDGDGIGDLRGLRSRLDYLNDGDSTTTSDLEVDGLWLMPIFRSPSYHGYDVTDYERVNPDYGTEADLDSLLAAAHARGMRVIVDLVMNHTSEQHPWFVEAASGQSSPRRDWYVWSSKDLEWGQPWNAAGDTWHRKGDGYYYGIFWSGMPDLNFRTRAVREEMKRVAESWLRRGIDGFRLDATRHLVETGPGAGQSDTEETRAFLRELSAHIRRVRPDALLVGENWTDTPTIAEYFGSQDSVVRGDGLPCNFNFPLAAALIDGVKSGDARGTAGVLREMERHYPKGALDAPFLTNHDVVRVATQLSGDAAKLHTAAAALLTLPGIAFLYYGEEIGMENGPGKDDPFKRTPMAWDASAGGGFTAGTPWHALAPGKDRANVASQASNPASLLSRYRALIRMRHALRSLRTGKIEVLTPDEEPTPVLAFTRAAAGERLLVLHNLGDREVTAGPYAVGASIVSARSLSPMFLGRGVGTPMLETGTITVTLPPYATGIWGLPASGR